MNDMIGRMPLLHDKFLMYGYESIASNEPRPWFISPRDFADPRIDEFLNYCFKFQVEIPEATLEILRKKSNYYRWLLGLDAYDYSTFDDSWLEVHYTVSYKKRFKESVRLQDFMLNRLKNRSSSIIERKYLQIYVLPMYPEG